MDLTTALIIALANALLPNGERRIVNVYEAKSLIRSVFTGKQSTLKIACIKFVREQTSMSLLESKNLVEAEIFGNERAFTTDLIDRIQREQGLPRRYFD